MNLNEQISKSGYTIVKYYADWCGPCKMMNPIMDKVAKQDDVTVVSVNTEDEPELTTEAGVVSLPTLAFYKDGELMGSYVGAMSEPLVMKAIAGELELTK